jgi:hypothetical protein
MLGSARDSAVALSKIRSLMLANANRRAPRLPAGLAVPFGTRMADYSVKACKRQGFRRLFGHKGQNRTATLS